MILKEKSWLWYLTFPFAHKNYTTLGKTLYCPRGATPSATIIAHESIHSLQQANVGVVKFILLYLLVLPILWNPFRYKWEMEAMTGSGLSKESAEEKLKSYKYGWLCTGS